MREVYYLVVVVLMLGVLAGFSSLNPTGAYASNLLPVWDYPSSELFADKELVVDLNKAFFDPDGDVLSFSVAPGKGISAGINSSMLVVLAESDGSIIISASDGKGVVSKKVMVYRSVEK